MTYNQDFTRMDNITAEYSKYNGLTLQLKQLYDDYVTILSETSQPVSQLSSVAELSSNDLFLVSKHANADNGYDNAVDHALIKLLEDHGYQTGTYEFERLKTDLRRFYDESCKCSYDVLSANMFNDIKSFFTFGTMAFHDSWEYAKNGHTHPYSNFHIYPLYQVSDEIQTPAQLTNLLAVFHITNDGITEDISVCMPQRDISVNAVTPMIGEVKLLALNANRLPRVSSFFDRPTQNGHPYRLKSHIDFDGWVWLDGSLYAKDDFPEAWETYKNMPKSTATVFEVPDYQNQFVKMNPRSMSFKTPLDEIAYHNGLPKHTHEITGQMSQSELSDIEMNAQFDFDNCNRGTGGPHLHSGNKYDPSSPLTLSIDFSGAIDLRPVTDTNTNGPKFENTDVAEKESYPTYMKIPALVYIGKKKTV